jgi:acyl-coenzyme A synthetase/AMP-(fatty) acid ligase
MSAVVGQAGRAVRAPLVAGPPGRILALVDGRPVSLAAFLRQVRGVAESLPPDRNAVNLCEDRYRFLVAFCAVAMRGQATLLPASRAPAAIDDALAMDPDAYCLGDAALATPPPRYRRLPHALPERDGPPPAVDDCALAAIGFTSGSSGRPSAHRKTWGGFRVSNAQNLAALADLWPTGASPAIVATVPQQHMYGMEMSVLLPLLGGAAVHAGRPLLPSDVAACLEQAGEPRLLVTTPVHLRALLGSGLGLPPLAGIVSATAPLSQELAARAEDRYGCQVRELFGATETCVLAQRRTARDPAWTAYPAVRLQPQPDGTRVQAAHLAGPVLLADRVEPLEGGRFLLRGRNADLLEIAGKRASLGDLTRRLLAIDGIQDAVVFQLGEDGDPVRRIAALAVAPGLDEAAILAALRASCDPVFLPRRLRLVSALPRNETGKLPRQALLDLLDGPLSAPAPRSYS